MAAEKMNSSQWITLARNDWSEVLELSKKKAFQRKFQIVEGFVDLVSKNGVHNITFPELAKRCKISRQLLEHHFDSKTQLILLSYRFVFARLQKLASDAVVVKQNPADQFAAYLSACAKWTQSHRADAKFVVQFYAICGTDAELFALYDRNRIIGQERIFNMLSRIAATSGLTKMTAGELSLRAASIQKLIIGYFVQVSQSKDGPENLRCQADELTRSALAVVRGR